MILADSATIHSCHGVKSRHFSHWFPINWLISLWKIIENIGAENWDSKCVLNAFFVQIKFDAKNSDRVCTTELLKTSLENQKINLISELIFAGYKGNKNQVQTRQKIKLVSKLIFFLEFVINFQIDFSKIKHR